MTDDDNVHGIPKEKETIRDIEKELISMMKDGKFRYTEKRAKNEQNEEYKKWKVKTEDGRVFPSWNCPYLHTLPGSRRHKCNHQKSRGWHGWTECPLPKKPIIQRQTTLFEGIQTIEGNPALKGKHILTYWDLPIPESNIVEEALKREGGMATARKDDD